MFCSIFVLKVNIFEQQKMAKHCTVLGNTILYYFKIFFAQKENAMQEYHHCKGHIYSLIFKKWWTGGKNGGYSRKIGACNDYFDYCRVKDSWNKRGK